MNITSLNAYRSSQRPSHPEEELWAQAYLNGLLQALRNEVHPPRRVSREAFEQRVSAYEITEGLK